MRWKEGRVAKSPFDVGYTLYSFIATRAEMATGSQRGGVKMDQKNFKNDAIVPLKLEALLGDREEARLSRFLEKKIKSHGKISVFLELENYPAADSAESLYEDMKLLKLHADDIERLAVVGDRVWQETWVAIFGLFSGMETAYFDRSEEEKAVEWVDQQMPETGGRNMLK
ncbi:MAG: STAS/SEC14 domain-containing protein [Deltaproteobacteria bacterium]|nr:STAS/SEC14 domain-containing protein [Deltaproteobacteria bacterium]